MGCRTRRPDIRGYPSTCPQATSDTIVWALSPILDATRPAFLTSLRRATRTRIPTPALTPTRRPAQQPRRAFNERHSAESTAESGLLKYE